MNSAKKTAFWLVKTSCYLSIIAFAVIYICSFMWLKMGMGYTQTIFNHAIMEANTNLTQPNVRVGDLIIAKEYLYSKTPDIYDVIVYPYNEEIHISIVEQVYEEDDNIYTFKVTPYNDEASIVLHKEDIIGELYIVAEGLGKAGMFLASPMFVCFLYGVIGLIIILFKCTGSNNKSRGNNMKKVDSTTDIEKIASDSDDVQSNSLGEDKSLNAYLDKASGNASKNSEVVTNQSDSVCKQDTTSKDNTIKTNKTSKVKKHKRRKKANKNKTLNERKSYSKKKPTKKHYNKYNRKKKINKKKTRNYKTRNCKK